MENNNKNNSVFKEWLEKLQQESWQLELLISGFAIFGIYSSRVAIQDFTFFTRNDVSGSLDIFLSMLSYVFKTGWFIFLINLIIHVLLRGLWIGAIGLRYVSEEIDYDGLNYSERFTKYLKEKVGSFDDYIERLEKMCSVIFSFTFLLFALFCSLIIFFLPIVLFTTITDDIFSDGFKIFSGILIFFYVGIGFFVLIDLLTLGGIKRIKEKNISKIYFYLYKYYSFVTLSFLYRPLLYNFIDNSYTKKLFFLSIPYIFFLLVGKNMFENKYNPYLPEKDILLSSGLMIDDYYYDDLRLSLLQEYPNEERKMNKKSMYRVSLEHYHLKDSYSSIFIRIDKKLLDLIEYKKLIQPYSSKGLSFVWFNNHKIDDLTLEKIKKEKELKIAELYKIKRNIREKFKNEKNIRSNKSDSIINEIKLLERFYENKITIYESNKSKKGIEAIVSQYEFYIKNKKINFENCSYYYHPHYLEQGLKCIYNTDSIPKGVQQLKIKYKTLSYNKDLSKDSLSLPILKY